MHTTEQLNSALAGRYAIERIVGEGGMATVYLARDVKHNRKVALKVLKPDLGAIVGVDRFLAEIQVTANLQHPNLLPLFDSGAADSLLFYVMPYIDGESLRARLDREKQLPIDDAIRIAASVASALDYAHRHGVIHRDLKPENVLLHDGNPLVADFGIALAVSNAGGSRITQTGLSLGTPMYMSPEQATGDRAIDARTDIYSLGALTYEMLTGEPPHTGSTSQAIIARVLTEKPRSIRASRASVPVHVEATVDKALEKLPADRWTTAREFSEALSGTRSAVPTDARGTQAAAPQSGGARKSFALGGASATIAVATALATLAGGYAVGRRSAPEQSGVPIQFTITLPDSVNQVQRCCGPSQALSPDGSTLVYVGTRSGQKGMLYRRAVGRLESEPIPGTADGSVPFFSPDSKWIGFEASGVLRKVAVSGGPATPIASAIGVRSASWGDDDRIVYSESGKLWTVPAAGGTPLAVPKLDKTVQFIAPWQLPGGQWTLATMLPAGGLIQLDERRIVAIELASGRTDTIGYGTRAAYASGYLVFSGADRTLMAQPFDPTRRKTTGAATVLIGRIGFGGTIDAEFSLSTNGWLEYLAGFGDANEEWRVSGPSGIVSIPLPGRSGDNLEDPAIAPDGRRIAMRLTQPNGERGDLWILDRQQSTLTRFTVGGAADPVWSHDGRRIAYFAVADKERKAGIYIRSSDQSDAEQLVLAGQTVYPASWLPGDSGLVIGGAQAKTSLDIGVVSLGDTVPRWIVSSEFIETHPQLSPDGKRLAFTSLRSGKGEVYVQPMPNAGAADGLVAATQVSTAGASSPRWSPDGRTLYYVQGQTIVAAALDLGAGITVTSRKTVVNSGITDLNPQNVNWDIFPDGKQFLYVNQGDLSGQVLPRIVLIQNWVQMVKAMRAAPK